MLEEVYAQLDDTLIMPVTQRIFPDPANVAEVPQLIKKLGGVDMVVGGIGINGHIAFNEPDEALSVEAFLNLKTRVLTLDEQTRAVNAMSALTGALELMPHQCITVGFKEIYEARKIRLCCFREWHNGVVRRTSCGEVTTEFPATLLQNHADARLLVPAEVLQR